jgi:hypothetical protein
MLFSSRHDEMMGGLVWLGWHNGKGNKILMACNASVTNQFYVFQYPLFSLELNVML